MRDYVEHWSASALCAQTDWTLFFPEKGDSAAPRLARAICRRCTVRVECAADALPGEQGIWGGRTRRERQEPGRKRGKDKSHTKEGRRST